MSSKRMRWSVCC